MIGGRSQITVSAASSTGATVTYAVTSSSKAVSESQNRRLGNADEIVPASDAYQLAGVFWYLATGRHPSGILSRDDWTGPDWLFEPLYASLQHDIHRRAERRRARRRVRAGA